jgi:serine/threonine protein kinase
MSLSVYTNNTKEVLKLMPKPFASGGEGSLYKVEMPLHWRGHVVKIYHPPKRTAEKQQKIQYLIRHAPKDTTNGAIIWVEEMVRDVNNNFLGLIMPMARGEKLEILCSNRLPRKLQTTWYRFHPDAPQSLHLRLRVCYNLVVAIQQIHALERYILVDFKPDNVIIEPNGIVALVDLDSVEVVEDGQKLFDAPVATPEYTPPEYYRKSESDPTEQQAWDRFSLAVVCYKLLLGVHPFAATHKEEFASFTNLAQKIENGLYVHDPKWKRKIQGLPPLHQKYYQLHPSIQNLFERCFIEGHTAPERRPSALEWCSVLLQYLDVNSHRELPSAAIDLVAYDSFFELQEKPPSPDAIIANFDKKERAIEPQRPYEDYQALKTRRQIGWLVLIVVAILTAVSTYFISWVILVIVTILTGMVLVVGYEKRINKIATWATLQELEQADKFWTKQHNIYIGVEKHLQDFYYNLRADYQQLIRRDQPTSEENIVHAIELEQVRLKKQLEQEDRKAKQLIDSERFEYERLNEKYIRALHTYPDFAESVSLDAELSAIDFARQEALAQLHRELNKDLKKEQQYYGAQIETKERFLEKIERDSQKKLDRERKYLQLAKAKAIKKAMIETGRDLLYQYTLTTPENIAEQITSFREEIQDLLINRAKIDSLKAIKNITKNGLILQSGKRIPLSPLRYFHIHELISWWQKANRGQRELTAQEFATIDRIFAKRLTATADKLQRQLRTSKNTVQEEINGFREKLYQVRAALRLESRGAVQVLQEQYEGKRKILNKLANEKAAEEQVIHERYDEKYQILLDNAAKKVEELNRFIKALFLRDKSLEDKKIQQYNFNLEKYRRGIQRLIEEHQRLEYKQQDKWRNDHLRKYRLSMTLGKHLLQMCYLNKIEPPLWKKEK